MNRKQDGFTLVEVIIAIMILAVLALPILAYFTNAAVSTSRGKDTQKAGMAAQSVMEELQSCTSYEQIEEKLAVSGSAWTVDSIDEANYTTELAKEVTVDGTPYQVKVKLDYEDKAIGSSNGVYKNLPSTSDVKYNDYEVPQLSEIYSPNTVVIAEEMDQADVAAGNFYYEDTSVKQDDIKKSMDRTLCLDVAKISEDGKTLYQVKGYYVYEYSGKNYTAVLKDTKIEADKLTGIYLFYNLMREDIENEKVQVNLTGDMDAKKLNLYFICQETPTVSKPQEGEEKYYLVISGSGHYLEPKYFTNGIGIKGAAVSSQETNVTRKKEKRIARAIVDVYDMGAAITDENRIVRVQTKGE